MNKNIFLIFKTVIFKFQNIYLRFENYKEKNYVFINIYVCICRSMKSIYTTLFFYLYNE